MIDVNRKTIATGIALLATVGTTVLGVGSTSAGATERPRKTCQSYTFEQVSTNGGAKLRTVVQVCNYKEPCETRYIVVSGKAPQLLSTTCLLPPPPRRTR